MRRSLRALLVVSLLAPLTVLLAAPVGAGTEKASFIITLRDGNPQEVAAEHARRYGADVEFVYSHALQGYAARVSEARIGELARDRRVASIERDQVVTIDGTIVGTETGATWGLDRIDDRSGLDASYTWEATGAGVTAYIIDTGIRTSHQEFGGRASIGTDTVGDGQNGQDCNGHGTHVAGTVGGATYGVAKGVNLVAVRVLNCSGSGTWSGVIAGIDWVTGDVHGPAVANMSLGGGASTAVDSAVENSIAAGVSYAIAAGNGNKGGRQQDACGSSPARVPEAMTIGATDRTDTKTSWSNYGDCVDWFAPGYQITSAWIDGDTATNTISGTSMATPHTTGAAALYLELNPGSTPADVRDGLYAQTTKGVVQASYTTNNDLLYTLSDSGGGSGGGGTEPPPPSGTPTVSTSCSKTTCTFDATPNATSWSFGDGETGTGDPVSHDFVKAGTYDVTATFSASSTVTVQVGCAVKGRWVHCSAV